MAHQANPKPARRSVRMLPFTNFMIERICQFSPCRLYRYTLWRNVSLFGGGLVQFIGLNPSTADENQNDPTVTRCMNFAEDWGYGVMCMTNLFAWRDTDPDKMKAAAEPVGRDNLRWLRDVAMEADLVVCCWGNDGAHQNQSRAFLKSMIDWPKPVKLFCLGRTGSDQPKHPLYLKGDLRPIPFNFKQR